MFAFPALMLLAEHHNWTHERIWRPSCDLMAAYGAETTMKLVS